MSPAPRPAGRAAWRLPAKFEALEAAMRSIALGPDGAGALLCDLAEHTERLQLEAEGAGEGRRAAHLSAALKYLCLALTSLRLATLDLDEGARRRLRS